MVDLTETKQRRRILTTLYRVYTSDDEEQCRALTRLESLTSEEYAMDVWLSTGPDPQIVEQILTFRLVLETPLRSLRVAS